MPPQRTPLRDIDGNRRGRGIDLTPHQRGRIEGARVAGMPLREIELEENVSRGAVRGTLALEKLRTDGHSMPRPGCPKTYDERDTRMMLRNLRFYPKSTFQQRRDDTGLDMSNSHIKRIARANGLAY
jgi:hypothetical protein